MKIGRIALIILFALLLACNFITQQFALATPTPLTPAYVPSQCVASPLATIPAATELAVPTSFLPTDVPITPQLEQKVFEEVVSKVQQVYVYPDYNGKDWPGLVTTYRAKIAAETTTEGYYQDMEALITALGDEHSQFESPAVKVASNAELAGKNDFVGIGVIVKPLPEKGDITILSVFPGSPAEKSGLIQHDSILTVDELPLVDKGTALPHLVRGPECSAVVLKVRSPGGAPRDLMLVRARIEGGEPIIARLVATTDGSRIGYIFLPTFFDKTIPQQVADSLKNWGQLDGLIIDNRFNPGGSSDVFLPVLSYFASGTLGAFKSHAGSRPMKITPHGIANSQSVPLVVLVGVDTVSFGEIFSGVLQDSGRAKIIGQTTLGNVETLHGYDLADGSQLWIAQETFDPAVSHANWEQTGIIPEVQAYADWDTFTFETDPAIAAALKLLGHK